MKKKTYAERLDNFNRRMKHFKTKFTRKELDRFRKRKRP